MKKVIATPSPADEFETYYRMMPFSRVVASAHRHLTDVSIVDVISI